MNATTTALTRNLDEAMLGGVLAGIASRYDWDPTLLRLVAALVAIATGIVPGVLIYVVAWVLIPRSDAIVAAPPAAEGTPTTEATDATDEQPAAEPAGQALSDEMTEALRDAADRLGEAATIAAEAARKAANEIGEVARRPRVAATPSADTTAAADESPAPPASEAAVVEALEDAADRMPGDDSEDGDPDQTTPAGPA